MDFRSLLFISDQARPTVFQHGRDLRDSIRIVLDDLLHRFEVVVIGECDAVRNQDERAAAIALHLR